MVINGEGPTDAQESHEKITIAHLLHCRMVAQLISGTEISKQLLSEVAEKLKKRKESNSSFRVVLAIVQVGDRSDSNVYIGAKIKKAAEIGAEGRLVKLPDTLTQAELEEEIEKLNADDDVDGIIVQVR
ncbi:tetrahydrofolate dehydrogenase/cyclohydrolase, catalytic domain protein [Ancylostoma caninum]|uniref:Tetrahydrofolate dehydrogenase/cyclohydrolase, catalytic domain protein n=1 Tax=Ancylostoma caninum TaxID=29170 RepID=A0A368GPZ4_ANCCA|nr:tetrahydrofolate dehydrogenase/cyclohydrolase, catalytic domain protein [Ancylostoma caninum]